MNRIRRDTAESNAMTALTNDSSSFDSEFIHERNMFSSQNEAKCASASEHQMQGDQKGVKKRWPQQSRQRVRKWEIGG
jgi:hypothetical protein